MYRQEFSRDNERDLSNSNSEGLFHGVSTSTIGAAGGGIWEIITQVLLFNLQRHNLSNVFTVPGVNVENAAFHRSLLRFFSESIQNIQNLTCLFSHSSPVMPFNIILVHQIIGIVG